MIRSRRYITHLKFTRFYLEKPNGKLRPIGAPEKVSKLAQAKLAFLMSIYTNEYLSPTQHGFRAGKGVWTA
jgi:hypothetical protein